LRSEEDREVARRRIVLRLLPRQRGRGVRLVAYAALASAVPGFFLGLLELACSALTTVLAVCVLTSRRPTP
jgi:hypothetical protein